MPLTIKLSPQAKNPESDDMPEPSGEPLRAFMRCPFMWILLIAALVSGAVFLVTQPQAWLAGDAEMYYNLARWLALGEGMPNGGLFAFHILRAPVYVAFLAGIISLFHQAVDADGLLQVIRYAQLALYGLNLWLIYACARELNRNRSAGLLAMGLAVLYGPLLFQTGRLLTETLVISFLLGAVLGWLRHRPLVSGLLCFLGLSLSFYSMTSKLLLLGLVGSAALLIGGNPSFRLRTAKFLGVLLGLAVVAYFASRAVLSDPPANEFFMGFFADNAGWSPMVALTGQMGYMAAQHQPLPFSVDWLPETWAGAIRWTWYHPETAVELALLNIYRLFSRPDNVYLQSWLGISPALLVTFHQWLMLLYAVSLPLAFQNRRYWVLYLLPLAWGLPYTLYHVENRYLLSAMPFIILMSGCGLDRLICGGLLAPRHLLSIGLPLLTLTMWLNGLFYPILLRAWEGLSYTLYAASGIALLAVWLLGLLIPLFRQEKATMPTSPEFLSLLLVLAVTLPMLTAQVLTPAVHEWRVPLSGNAHVRRSIPLDEAFFRPVGLKTFLVLETRPAFAPLIIRVNGMLVKTGARPAIGLYKQKYLLGGLIDPANLSQYRFIPLDNKIVASMARQYQAEISIAAGKGGESVDLVGDYPAADDLYHLPNPDWQHYSIYKTLYDRDGRPPVTLSSRSPETGQNSESLYSYGKRRLGDTDLSPEPGLQAGQYRVFLMRLHPEDVAGDYPSPQFRMNAEGNIFKLFRLAY